MMLEDEGVDFDNTWSPEAVWDMLVHLRSEYFQLQRAETALQRHRMQWMSQIEQWMVHQEALVRNAELGRPPQAAANRPASYPPLSTEKDSLFCGLNAMCPGGKAPDYIESESTRECTNTSESFGGASTSTPRQPGRSPRPHRGDTQPAVLENDYECHHTSDDKQPLQAASLEFYMSGEDMSSSPVRGLRGPSCPVKPVTLEQESSLEPAVEPVGSVSSDALQGPHDKYKSGASSSRFTSNGASVCFTADIMPTDLKGLSYDIVSSRDLDQIAIEEPRESCRSAKTHICNMPSSLGMMPSHLTFDQRQGEALMCADDELPKVVQLWSDLVLAALWYAKKDLRQLRSVWVQSETFLAKAAKTGHVALEVFGGGHLDDDRHSEFHSEETQKHTKSFMSMATMKSVLTRSFTERYSTVRPSRKMSSASSDSSSMTFGPVQANATIGFDVIDTGQAREGRRSSIIMNPTSSKRLGWVFIGMALMLYDLIVFPLSVFQPKDNDLFLFMKWFSQIYWTLDIGISFITGVTINGGLITDPFVIARVYIKTWLPFDCLVTLPLWVIIAFNLESGNSSSIRSVRYFRMLRFLRLMRVAKFEHMLGEALEFVNSSTVILTFGIVKLMVYVVLLNHFNACLWFMIGNRDHGWADDETGHTANRLIIYQYFCAMHWALTQFQGTSEILPGTTLGERIYAAGFLLFALMIMASFVGTLTNMILQLQHLNEERKHKERQMRSFLVSNHISMELSMRVKKYVEWKLQLLSSQQQNSEVLGILPITLVLELLREVRGPVLASYRFFELLDHCHPRVFRRVCHEAIQPHWEAPNELIFNTSDRAENMFFITQGLLKYTATTVRNTRHKGDVLYADLEAKDPEGTWKVKQMCERPELERQHFEVSRGNWLCEASLWVDWEHCGELVAVSDASILALGSISFEKVVQSELPVHAAMVLYARRFLAALNRFGKVYSDYILEGGIVDLNTHSKATADPHTDARPESKVHH